MKLILCTLAICLSIFASFFTTKELIRSEGKKVRSAIPKSLAEQEALAGRADPAAQKLDAINAQLATISRRLSALEEASARPNVTLATASDASGSAAAKNGVALAATLARLDAVPGQLNEITAYLDQSFEFLEKTIADKAPPERFAETFDTMSKKVDAIDSYFVPLYTFLGVVYDPANSDLVAAYPSVDARINELFLQVDAIRTEVTALRDALTPRNIDPGRHPRY